MLLADIAYIAVVSRDVDRTAHLFAHTLGLARTEIPVADLSRTVPFFAVGRSAIALFAPGDPFLGGDDRTGVHSLAFAAADIDAAVGHVESAGIAHLPGPVGPGLQNRKRIGLDPAATAGVRTYITEPVEQNASPPGKVERIDHIGIASADNAAAVDIFSRRLGLALESQQTDMEVEIAVESFTSDKYGVVHHTRPARAVGGLRVAFVTVGECELEFLQNFDPRHSAEVGQGPGSTKQDQGAIARYVARRGVGLHHLALKTPDIDGALAALADGGYRVIDRVGRPGSRRARIGFVHPAALGGVLLHFVEREEA